MSVYFARVGTYIKVGFSENPERRVKNLFKSATYYSRPIDCPTDPTQRELLATIPGRLDEERICHAALDDFAVGGEFFVDEPQVREFIAEALAGRFPTMTRDAGPAFDEGIGRYVLTDDDHATCLRAVESMFDSTSIGRKAAS